MITVTSTQRHAVTKQTKYTVQSSKKGVPEAEIYKEDSGNWTIKYLLPRKFKHRLKSYQAAIQHLTNLGW